MDKLKGVFKVSDRDKKLLVGAFAVIIVLLSYFVGYQNLTREVEASQKEASDLRLRRNDLVEKNRNKSRYEADTKKLDADTEKLLKEYANGSSQPVTLNFLNSMEMTTGSWIKSVTFSEPAEIYTFGQITTSNPTGTGSAYKTDKMGYEVTVDISYEADYTQWKDLIKFINEYDTKNAIEAITVYYSQSTGVVSGTITLSTYAITGSDRVFTEPKLDMSTGTTNIFDDGGYAE